MRKPIKSGIHAKRKITLAALRAFEARIDQKCIEHYTTSLYSFDAPTLNAVFPARYKALKRIRKIANAIQGNDQYLRDHKDAEATLKPIYN